MTNPIQNITPLKQTPQNTEKKKSAPDDSDTRDTGAPRWYILYGDLMSVVLIFFVLLFSMSTTNKARYQASVKSMQEALLSKAQLNKLEKTDIEKLMEIKKLLDKQFNQSDMKEFIETFFTNKGIRIIVKNSIVFESGDSRLLGSAIPVLTTIAQVIRDHSFPIVVEGHTDNIPILSEKFPSNWELSTARASSVVRFFINYAGIDKERLIATGLADNQPIAENNNELNRAKNRRVEILVFEGDD